MAKKPPNSKAPKPKPEPSPEALERLRTDAEAARSVFQRTDRAKFAPRRTAEREEAFLDGLRDAWSVTHSAQAAGITRMTAYAWRKASEATRQEDGSYTDDFCVRWSDAVDAGVDKLEDEVTRRAARGYEKPVYQGGVLVGTVTEYSDALLQVAMKAKRPERYNTERHEHTGKDGGSILQKVEIEFVDFNGKK